MAEDATRRIRDHAAIGRLVDDVLPALVARLGASGLGELEVREDGWRVRLRRPPGPRPAARAEVAGRRTGSTPARPQPGHAGHGHHPAAIESAPTGREGRVGTPSGNGEFTRMAAVGPGPVVEAPAAGEAVPRPNDAADDDRVMATAPAVGIYHPGPDIVPGTRVRAGDAIGVVDVLGVRQEVVAPVDGIIGAAATEPGEPVEYGQELVWIERPQPAGGPAEPLATDDPAGPEPPSGVA